MTRLMARQTQVHSTVLSTLVSFDKVKCEGPDLLGMTFDLSSCTPGGEGVIVVPALGDLGAGRGDT